MTVDYHAFEVMTFDCYGTLIDWEAGIATGLRAALPDLADVSDDELLQGYAVHEAATEAGPYLRYRDVLATGLRAVAADHGLTVDDDAVARFAESVGEWPAFPDSADALARLHRRHRLGVITNCDTDLFARSAKRLDTEFDWVISAEMAGSYKPARANFDLALATIDTPRERILHVAQSLFHDHVPARLLGMTTVWIDRRHDRPGFGATPPASATPDARFTSMRAFADAAA
jgi:2-haloacid dehalogenase